MEEKILYQFVMNYKAYRRVMIASRVGISVIVAGGLAGLCAVSIVLGLIVPAMALCFGAITVIVGLHNERSYAVYNTKVVLRKKGNRITVPMQSVVGVKYKRAFYEKDLATGTVTVIALNGKGKKKKYRMRHIFDCAACVGYLAQRAAENTGSGAAEK